MNKSVGIGAIIAVILGIIIVSVSMNSVSDEDFTPEGLPFEESTSIDESEIEIIEKTGRDFSVEFTESISLTSP